MNQTYFEWYEFDVNVVRTLIATCTNKSMLLQFMTKFRQNQGRGRSWSVQGLHIKARLHHIGKPARKFVIRSYILDINRLQLRQVDKKWRAKQRKCITVSSSLADLYPQQKLLNGSFIHSACLPTTQRPVSTASVVDMTHD